MLSKCIKEYITCMIYVDQIYQIVPHLHNNIYIYIYILYNMVEELYRLNQTITHSTILYSHLDS